MSASDVVRMERLRRKSAVAPADSSNSRACQCWFAGELFCFAVESPLTLGAAPVKLCSTGPAFNSQSRPCDPSVRAQPPPYSAQACVITLRLPAYQLFLPCTPCVPNHLSQSSRIAPSPGTALRLLQPRRGCNFQSLPAECPPDHPCSRAKRRPSQAQAPGAHTRHAPHAPPPLTA